MNAGLLVIDVQQSFTQAPYFQERDLPAFLRHQNELIAGAEARDIPVLRIFHVSANENSPFALQSGWVRPMEGLRAVSPAATFHKSRHSAMIGSGLDVWLTQNGIRKLIVSGIRSEQCCETTTRHASDLGYSVDYVLDATLTFDMKHIDGSLLPADTIKQRTAAVLHDRFARVCSVEQALESASAH